MLTRSKAAWRAAPQDNAEPSDRLCDLPLDRGVTWTFDVCKLAESARRMGGYRASATRDEALRNGMLVPDYPYDVQHGLCTVVGFQLSFTDTMGTAGTCPNCFGSYMAKKRGRVFVCGHQVCFACEQEPNLLQLRCQCGRPYVRIP